MSAAVSSGLMTVLSQPCQGVKNATEWWAVEGLNL